MITLDILGLIAAGMGQPFSAHARNFIPGICAILGDQKASTRAAAVCVLDTFKIEMQGIDDGLISCIATALETANPALRASLTAWTLTALSEKSHDASLDLTPLHLPILACLEDKSGEVRKSAQGILTHLVRQAGPNALLAVISRHKPASQSTLSAAIKGAANQISLEEVEARPKVKHDEALHGGPPAQTPVANVPKRNTLMPTTSRPSNGIVIPTRPVVNKAAAPRAIPGRLGIRPPTIARTSVPSRVMQTSNRAPHSESQSDSASQNSTVVQPNCFLSADADAKAMRQARDKGRAITDASSLRLLFEHCATKSFTMLAFSTDHHFEKDFISSLTMLSNIDDDMSIVNNIDLIFKYVSLRLSDNLTSIILKCLDVVDKAVEVLDRQDYNLTEWEASLILPAWISKVFF